ncbi:dTMP kinase [bacterium]|nr:MAG: dTMP kinase [bacterium]
MLITFEGIDGSGKSTQIRLLKDYLEKQLSKQVFVFREPGGNQLSEKIRSLLLDDSQHVQPVTELLLFSAARAQLMADQVKPLLDADEIVILDRFYDSTTAYQGFGRNAMPIQDIKKLNSIASLGYAPDITFYLRLNLAEAEKRREGTSKDRMEQSGDSFYYRVIEGFDKLTEEEARFCAIDATMDIEHIHQMISEKVMKSLKA